ncbi:medium-chain acyl-CoA ligase ACSF2, mitochondrial-like isoform X2 [Homarus americanus]|uniref:medium-chain acyl-CoA ligase ACSF2, mitochondrial-like isoform X2 n=1 Tax=Homarus americanus TaxID=6706 RepID=UPI001C481217|nr:medium-chain acyl-CoA ligase ACSF2, mitochondrial-like isoform X2 [Homarus americanus]
MLRIISQNRLILQLKTWIRQQSSDTSAWSYLSNPGKWPLLGISVGQVMNQAAEIYGDQEAIVSIHQATRRTFTQVQQESEQLAAGLLALGLQRGDRLGIWGPNSYEWYLTQFAAAKAGLILVNINPAYRPSELEYCLNKVSVKAIVCHEKFKTSDYYQMLCDLAPELPSSPKGELKSSKLPHLKQVIMCSARNLSGAYKFGDVLEAGDNSHVKILGKLSSKIKIDDPCNIQFTSGTTGSPKAAVLTHHMLVNNSYSIGKRAEYDKKIHRICLPVPLYHCFGCVTGSLVGASFGATCIMPSEGFDPEACVHALQDERITSCYGTPTMFVDILNVQQRLLKDVSSLSTGIMAGAPCPQELVMAVMNDLNMKDFLVMYGMTETSPVTFQCCPSDSPTVRSSTIGYPCDHIEVKVTDEHGNIVPVGEPGELCIRGYCNFLGYWGEPEKTKEMMGPDRWLKTGDLAVLQPDGYGQIIGRMKDMIIRGGENIYPAELENFLMGHPGIIEVQVFGVPDARMGEEVAAWIRKADNAELNDTIIKDWCKGKIAHYKVPRYILFKEEFPRTVTGKIQKFIMKDITVREFNLNW